MFKRVYHKNLRAGDKTHMAYRSRKSIEWISNLTRTGGDECPAEKYFKWLCLIHEVNPEAAIALHDAVTRDFEELRHAQVSGQWCAQETAAALLHQASESIGALLDKVTSNDEDALIALLVKVQGAIEVCRAGRGAR
jgi:hypothetical protein